MNAGAHIDWARLGRRSLVAGVLALGAIQILLLASGSEYGWDFRGGIWKAGHGLLAGASPYPPPNPAYLGHITNAFVAPPLLAVLGAPFSLLPWVPAVVLWNLICVASLAAALRVLGARDWRVYALAFSSFPFISSLGLGQPDGLFALLAALAWRYRDNSGGAVAAGALIAAKLMAWPLVLWLVITRRFRLAATAVVSAACWLAGSWAFIGFKGLAAYPHLLAAETRAFGPGSHSFVAGFSRLGIALPLAEVFTVAVVAAIAWALIAYAGRSDEVTFTVALAAGLFLSPVMWQHYLVLLFVPLAITQGFRDRVIWLLVPLLWLSPVEKPPTVWQTWLVPVLAAGIAVRAVVASSSSRPRLGRRWVSNVLFEAPIIAVKPTRADPS